MLTSKQRNDQFNLLDGKHWLKFGFQTEEWPTFGCGKAPDPFAYLIFVLFLHIHNFWHKFFSTPKCVNHDKTDFATKQRKSHKRKILQQNSITCDNTSKIVHIILTDLSPHFSCGEISPCDKFSPRLKGTISAFNLKFLHMAEFFSTGTACGACDKYKVWNRDAWKCKIWPKGSPF